MLAVRRIAHWAGETETTEAADAMARDTLDAQSVWWHRSTNLSVLARFKGSKELDPFIKGGDVSFCRADLFYVTKLALVPETRP